MAAPVQSSVKTAVKTVVRPPIGAEAGSSSGVKIGLAAVASLCVLNLAFAVVLATKIPIQPEEESKEAVTPAQFHVLSQRVQACEDELRRSSEVVRAAGDTVRRMETSVNTLQNDFSIIQSTGPQKPPPYGQRHPGQPILQEDIPMDRTPKAPAPVSQPK